MTWIWSYKIVILFAIWECVFLYPFYGALSDSLLTPVTIAAPYIGQELEEKSIWVHSSFFFPFVFFFFFLSFYLFFFYHHFIKSSLANKNIDCSIYG